MANTRLINMYMELLKTLTNPADVEVRKEVLKKLSAELKIV